MYIDIKNASYHDIDKISCIASEVFINDKYYNSIYEGENIKEWLFSIFRTCFDKCYDNGIIKIACDSETNEIIGFIVLFDYNDIINNNPSYFKDVFPEEINDLSKKMYNITKNGDYLYLLSIGTASNFQNCGVSKELIKHVINEYNKYKIISDVSSSILERILKTYYDFIIEFEYNGLKIMHN